MAVPNQQKYKNRTVQGKFPGLEWRVESGSTKPTEVQVSDCAWEISRFGVQGGEWQYQTNRSTSIGLCSGNITVWSGGWRVAVQNQQKYKYRTVQGRGWRVAVTNQQKNKYRTVQGKYPGLEWRVESGSTKPTEVQV